MMGTEQYFRDRILEIDSLAEVNFDIEIPMAVRIRPSHPRYRDVVARAREQMEIYIDRRLKLAGRVRQ